MVLFEHLRQDMSISFQKRISDSTSFCINNEKISRLQVLQLKQTHNVSLFWSCFDVDASSSCQPHLTPHRAPTSPRLSEYVCHQTEQKTCKFALMRGEVSAIYALCLFISPLSSHSVFLFLFLSAGSAPSPQTPERCFADAAQGVAGLTL